MNREELIQKLNTINVNPNLYSLYGELLPDRIILYNSYNDWIVFYFDERGNRNNEKIFHSEQDACEYIYKYFSHQMEIAKKYNANT